MSNLIHAESVSKNGDTGSINPKDAVEFAGAADQSKTNDFDPKNMHVQVLYRGGERIHNLTTDSMMTWLDAGSSFTRFQDPFGGWINTTRNWQTRQYLQNTDRRFLVMVDADVGVPWWVPFRMASHNLPVVSAIVPCFSLSHGGLFINIAAKDPSGTPRFPTLGETRTIPKEGLLEIENAGTGCLVIRRDVLEKLWQMSEDDETFGQPFEFSIKEMREAGKTGRIARGEDICFTDRVRQAGFKIYADFACHCLHDKGMSLAWPEVNIGDIDVDDWSTSVFDKQAVQI